MMRPSWLLLAGLALASCSPKDYVRTAYYGDLASLKREIGEARARGTLDRDGVVALARAVARREVRSVTGEETVSRVRSAQSCVDGVETELRERARTEDEAGAEALLVLAEAGRIRKTDLVARYARSPLGALRAVAARGATLPEDAALRRAFFTDADERVRQNAFRAALEARDPADVGALLEAARLDPEPSNRGLAARAAGGAGGASAVLGLRDVWATADAALRLSVVEAWAAPASFTEGGARELLVVAEARDSLASVAAAGQLVRIGAEGAAVGRAVVLRAITEGTTDERLVAIQLGPLSDAEVVLALERTARTGSEPPGIAAIVAWARLLDEPGHRKEALAQLSQVAQGKDAASRQARAALAMSEDPSVTPLLLADLSGADPAGRERAAVGLYRMGRAVDMAAALADSDPDVRFSVACSVLVTRPRPAG